MSDEDTWIVTRLPGLAPDTRKLNGASKREACGVTVTERWSLAVELAPQAGNNDIATNNALYAPIANLRAARPSQRRRSSTMGLTIRAGRTRAAMNSPR